MGIRDSSIVMAFLTREASYYRFKTNESSEAFINRMFQEISLLETQCDYYSIVSLSNLGVPSAELRLTSGNWKHGIHYQFLLPPSPLGKGNWCEVKT